MLPLLLHPKSRIALSTICRYVMTSTYNRDCANQLAVFEASKLIMLKSLNRLSTKLRLRSNTEKPIVIADLGTSGGANSMPMLSFVINHLHQSHKQSAQDTHDVCVYHNDQPHNDWAEFIRILNSDQSYKNQCAALLDVSKMHSYIVPRSFYETLFPTSAIDFVVSFITLHWLSSLPCSLPGFNVTTNSPDSIPSHILDTWKQHAHQDLVHFLNLRSRELAIGGQLVATMVAAPVDPTRPNNGIKEVVRLLDLPLHVKSGLLLPSEVERLAFVYQMRTRDEVSNAVKAVNTFQLQDLETVSMNYQLTNFELADFILSIHLPSIYSCLEPRVDVPVAPAIDRKRLIAQALRSSIASKLTGGVKHDWNIDYHILSLSRCQPPHTFAMTKEERWLGAIRGW